MFDMNNLQFYQESSQNCYRRKDQRLQFVATALILFAIATWFFIKAPGVEGYVTVVIAVFFGVVFINRMFNSVTIDLNNKTLIQKSSLFAPTRTVSLSDIQGFSIHNRIYGLVLISTATVAVNQEKGTSYLILCQNIMNTKKNEQFLLETEQLLKINDR